MIWHASRRVMLAGIALLALPRSALKQAEGNDDHPASAGGELSEKVFLRDYGADPSGTTSAVAAFTTALAAGKCVMGAPGDVYLLDAPVRVPGGRDLIGNGATLKIGANAIGLKLDSHDCKVRGWTIKGNGGLYAVPNTGDRNEFNDNACSGDIGHFFFSTNSDHVTATGNQVSGASAENEITTAIVIENCRRVRIDDNAFEQIPVGWGIQVRQGSEHFEITNNRFFQPQMKSSKAAFAGQKVFTFTLRTVCFLKKIQINGKPLSMGYTISGAGPTYEVTFESGRLAGETVTLIGYRGAENIQINTGSRTGIITGNTVDGTGDSGIVCYGSHLTVANNIIRNCGYAGVAIYGGQDHIVVANNVIAYCAQMDDGLSSPDDPHLASVFAGAILASGEDAKITNNTIINTSGTMRYGIRINKADMALRTDGSATITVLGNTFIGGFVDGQVFAPNDTTGERINSIEVDGPLVQYPGEIEIDEPWVHVPPGGSHFENNGFGKVWAIRDTKIRKGGVASLQTVAGEYIDFSLSAAAVLRNCNVTVSFWARAATGRSYLSVFTELDGLLYPLTADIIAPQWRPYSISFPLTANLADTIIIRCGATSGSANIQHVKIVGRRL